MKSALLVVLAAFAFAASGYAHANQSTGNVKVAAIGNWVGTPSAPNEQITIVTSTQSTPTNPAGCAYTDYYYLSAASNVSRSMLLAAAASGMNVQLVIYGGGCATDGRPMVVNVSLHP